MGFASRLRHTLKRLRRHKARRRAVQEFRRSLSLIVDSQALEASVSTRIKELFDPDRLVILQLDRSTGTYRPSFASGLDEAALSELALSSQGRLVRWFLVNETYLLLPQDWGVFEYLEPAERELLTRLGVQLCAPLLTQNHLAGILMLGTSRPDWLPDRRDGELLQQLAHQTSLAFQNAALYREQRERLDRLHRADRLAAVGQLAASVAHEVRNPLTAIRSTMQYLGSSYGPEDPKRELVMELIGEVDRIDSTISGLLSLTRSGELQPAEIDLIALLRQSVHFLEAQARKQAVRLEERYAEPSLRLEADAGQLKQVILNLVLNAFQAMPEGGQVVVAAAVVLSRELGLLGPAPGWAEVRISDNGPGIPAERLQKVFDPFFTT